MARRKLRTAEKVCGAGLALSLITPWITLGLTPSLLAHHTLVLEALSSSAISIVTGGARARVHELPLALVLAAPLCGVLLVDVFYWWAGRLWGDQVVRNMTGKRPRAARWVERVESWVARHGIGVLSVSYFLPVPNPLVYASCGAGGMPLLLFLLGDAIGTLLWTGLLAGLGWQLGKGAVDVVHAIDRYSLRATIAIVVVMVVVSVVRERRAAVGRTWRPWFATASAAAAAASGSR